jgi:response regulator RpfG family c-di-GMP phosphodiesterase
MLPSSAMCEGFGTAIEKTSERMSLSEGSSVSSSPEAPALAQALELLGDVADYAAGVSGQGKTIAAHAVAMARMADVAAHETGALFFAARLRNAGVLGNDAFSKNRELSEREARLLRSDVPARGARFCEKIAALPKGTAEIVRWQAECWDGTGYPDFLRWGSIPKAAQLLHIASAYAATADPDEGLASICALSGRAFAPQHVRTFVMWFHSFGGEIEQLEHLPASLDASKTTAGDLYALLDAAVRSHNTDVAQFASRLRSAR